jgi:hypothetical protein
MIQPETVKTVSTNTIFVTLIIHVWHVWMRLGHLMNGNALLAVKGRTTDARTAR